VRRFRPSPSMIVACIALLVAIGGTSYAAISVTGKNVQNGSLTGKDVKNGSVDGADVRNSSLTTSDIRNQSLLATDFKSGQLPQGPKGDKGDPGAPGSALGYATISDSHTVDPALSLNITTANVTQVGTVVCFNGLPFTPRVAVANVSAGAGTAGAQTIRTYTEDHGGCPGREQAAVTAVSSATSTEVDPQAFVIAFY
jgi:hypothetical protein